MFFFRPSGDKFVDRGDPSSYDFRTGDFTKDFTWRDLDLSSIISPGTKLVLFRIRIQVVADTAAFHLRKNGNSNEYNEYACQPGIANKAVEYDAHVAVDANGIAEYRCSIDTFTVLDVSVRGWFV